MDKNISFGMKGIEIINSVIKTPAERREFPVFAFDIQFKTNANPKDNVVTIYADVIIREHEKADQLGQFSALFHFGVDDLGKLAINRELNQVEIPQALISTFIGISASTLRGLMFGAFKGTFLHGAILPLVDIAALQPELAPISN